MTEFFISVSAAAIVYAVSILYAAIGEIFSQRAGIMNLGVEGIMLMGAVSGFLTVFYTNNLALAILVVILTGMLLGLVFAFITVTLQADQTVCGMADMTCSRNFARASGLASIAWIPFSAQ